VVCGVDRHVIVVFRGWKRLPKLKRWLNGSVSLGWHRLIGACGHIAG
jgi:hypothetical protein